MSHLSNKKQSRKCTTIHNNHNKLNLERLESRLLLSITADEQLFIYLLNEKIQHGPEKEEVAEGQRA